MIRPLFLLAACLLVSPVHAKGNAEAGKAKSAACAACHGQAASIAWDAMVPTRSAVLCTPNSRTAMKAPSISRRSWSPRSSGSRAPASALNARSLLRTDPLLRIAI